MLVPGPGLEPGWVAPTVFETVASTDSAIRAMERMHAHTFRACKGNEFFPFSQYCVAFCAGLTHLNFLQRQNFLMRKGDSRCPTRLSSDGL